MEFGRIASVDTVDWTLPVEDSITKDYLQGLPRKGRLEIHMGAPAWGAKAWLGTLYPDGTPANQFLHFYSRRFSTVELNTSHYRIPSVELVQSWRDLTPPDFQFCAKIFQGISHARNGLRDLETRSLWFEFLESLDGQAGPCFLQLPPHFDYGHKTELFHFVEAWPQAYRLAIELRHPSWFAASQVLPALVEYLQRRGVALVITDVAGRRDVLHTSLSAEFTMLRFIGNDLHPSDFTRADAWTERFGVWEQLGLAKLYLFVHEPEDRQTPAMAAAFVEKLRTPVGFKRGWDLNWGGPWPGQLTLPL